MNSEDITTLGLSLTSNNGGATLLRNGDEASEGFAVGGTMEFQYFGESKRLSECVKDAIECIADCTCCDAFGFWMNGQTLYIDAINIFDNESEALDFARSRDEIAIYDLTNQNEINC